ncbi:exopolyphosphatase [Microlunatus capsulatus]|uniref:Exopolyphosphatase/guanosine-5'-triphosphate, 3'-diphosphate pyrophosphatase n=1 Tax=Microlunatus capsulatus TaxID=99117 RepID=A0ABS4ZAU4_9ACTN|nr:Ppx/GppA phosphatase family protein [Microlunatus capsulatus]MBP2418114.1 exopolyphosphatase/guanosine-5'-triphosphate,3'-diphosphate pyrophosphatase [Microlunatus capsulatus]
MNRVAAVDCGTNSIRLLIAEPGPDGGLAELDRRTEVVRLGQGVDATGEFHPDALARTFAATDAYAALIRDAGVPSSRIRFVATSASRDARNREVFFAGIRERLGVTPEVISGDTEAQLSFVGALSRVAPAAEPVLVVDIGGGSTELIVGSAAGAVTSAISLDIGSVRLTERFLSAHPPAADAVAAATAHVDALLDTTGIDFAAVGTWIGVAGTATTLAGVHLGLEHYDRERVHGSVIALPDLRELFGRLLGSTVEQIRALPSMHPGRADVVTAGTLIAVRVAERLRVDGWLVSESDILDGTALDLLRRTDPTGPR